jgi:hypothetical protein
LHWLSRRWLYNIPRSLRTEGLRPLGRLALADHARPAGQRLRRAMVQSLDATAIAKSNAAIGQQFRTDALRVIVVASISGGTGSGMSLDIGYAVRAILQKLGLTHGQVIGLMMHSTGRDARHSELARVNAFSWLTEYHHFQQFENPYPGDVSCGLPAHAAGVPAFDHTYLLQLGDNLDGCEYDQATQSVAEYIRLSTLSPASAFFDGCRQSLSMSPPDAPALAILRSFGVYRQRATPTEICDEFAGLVTQHVLSIWRGAAASSTTSNGDADDHQVVLRLQLDAAGIAANARSLIELELRTDAASFLASWLDGQPPGNATTGMASIDQLFGKNPSGVESGPVTLLGRTPAEIVTPLSEKLRREVRRWVSQCIDDPDERLAGARRTATWASEHFTRVETELKRIRGAIADRLNQIRAEVVANNAAASTSGPKTIAVSQSQPEEYFHMWLDKLTILAAEHAVHVLKSEVKTLSDEITSLAREVDQIAAAAGRAANAIDAGHAANQKYGDPTSRAKLANSIEAKLPGIAAQVDSRLQAEYVEARGGLMKMIMQGGRPRAQLSAKLHELSRKAVTQALSGVNARGGQDNDMHAALALATPSCLEYGGQRRVLAILPTDASGEAPKSAMADRLGVPLTVIQGADDDITICVEANGLSLEHIALDLVERRRDRVEFAVRVHSRTDIAWTPLVSTETPRSSEICGNNVSRQTQAQHPMSKTLVM